jgi:glutamate--cysteine ligase
MDAIENAVETVLERVRAHYARYGITQEPYVYVKADSGTYGMGIMTVKSGAELREVNKKNRNKMNVIKEGVQSTEVMVQEGVPTIDTVDNHPAEPMIYLVNAHLVGGAYRVNESRDAYGNLNASGMRFARMCDDDETISAVRVSNCSLHAFGIVAGLASLASGYEEYGEHYSI